MSAMIDVDEALRRWVILNQLDGSNVDAICLPSQQHRERPLVHLRICSLLPGVGAPLSMLYVMPSSVTTVLQGDHGGSLQVSCSK